MNYYLKYKDIKVLSFDTATESVEVINEAYLPKSMGTGSMTYDKIKVFCSNRILMMNRKYSKEIRTSCGVDDQSDVSICIMCMALSFRDNYWIVSRTKALTWDMVNLYNNEFSVKIAKVALTGDTSSLGQDVLLSDKVFTGELTTKGTRAKCFYRDNGILYLIKNETLQEIKAEILSYYIATLLGIESTRYIYKKFEDKNCSVCKIDTNENREMIPCRDVMLYYDEVEMGCNTKAYEFFYKNDRFRFITMQVFDCITLNTDRNRDNYALLVQDRQIQGLYPVYDHDSCYKGKGNNAYYFVTGLTFRQSIDMLKSRYCNELSGLGILRNLEKLRKQLNEDFCLKYITKEQYDRMLKNIDLFLS